MILRLLYTLMSLTITLFCLPKALAEGNAVGLTLGGPTYIHFTHGLGGPTAIEAGVSFEHNDATHIYGDYLLETHDPIRGSQFNEVGIFYGVGGMIVINNKTRWDDDGYYAKKDGGTGFGVRVPVGLDWRSSKTQNFSFHVQIVPIVAVVPETELVVTAGIGLKYHF